MTLEENVRKRKILMDALYSGRLLEYGEKLVKEEKEKSQTKHK